MKRILLGMLLLVVAQSAHAQMQGYLVVQSCGGSTSSPLPYSIGSVRTPTMDVNGNICGASGGGSGTEEVIQPDVRTTGSLNTAGTNAYTVPINSNGIMAFNILGLTGTGATLTLQWSADGGTTWSTLNADDGVSTFTTNGQHRVNVGARTNVRLLVTTTGSGTATVTTNLSVASSSVTVAEVFPATPCLAAASTSSVVCKASSGKFYGAYGQVSGVGWVFVINTASTPSNGTLTVGTAAGNLEDCFEVGSAGTSLTRSPVGRSYSTGITLAFSSTACPVLTLSTSATFLTGDYQ